MSVSLTASTATDAYDAYGAIGTALSQPSLIAGRHPFHQSVLPNVLRDIRTKLALNKTDRLLEIGCNIGLLLKPLAEYVAEAVGQDHPALIAHWQNSAFPSNIALVGGHWPDIKPHGLFDKILIYSVVIHLDTRETTTRFIDAAFAQLKPGGSLLVGDIPNCDRRRRFAHSPEGRRIATSYDAKRTADRRRFEPEYAERERLLAPHPINNDLDDAYLLDLIRRVREKGHDAYILPQPENLPMSGTREDILLRKAD